MHHSLACFVGAAKGGILPACVFSIEEAECWPVA